MFIYVPIEDMEQRYTTMQNQIVKPFADRYIYPSGMGVYNDKIECGEFLDINKTNIFKAKQLEMISELFQRRLVQDGAVFFIADIFFPGIEMIRYMADLQDIKVKVYGYSHAGRGDPNDFVQKLGDWSDYSEMAYMKTCEAVFVGSKHQKENIMRKFPHMDGRRIIIAGAIWDCDYLGHVYDGRDEKEDFFIWPHRICEEKGIKDLIKFAKTFPQYKIVITSSGNRRRIELPENIEYKWGLTKKDYFKTMSKAKWYLSTAYQETFGYTLQEAIYFGCQVFVPRRACYPEMVPEQCLYNDMSEINTLIQYNGGHVPPIQYTRRWSRNFFQMYAVMTGIHLPARKIDYSLKEATA